MTTGMERTSLVFAKAARGLPEGADLVARSKRIVGHRRQRGVPKATLRRWRDAGWVVVEVTAQGRKRVITSAKLTAAGVAAAAEKLAAVAK